MTLGPTGICHERAAIERMRFQGVGDFHLRSAESLAPRLQVRKALRVRGGPASEIWANVARVTKQAGSATGCQPKAG
jgi:hypothetical protein